MRSRRSAITITTSAGRGMSASSLTVITVTPPPVVTGFTPTSGPVATTVTLTGSGLSTAIDVELGHAASSFTVDSVAQITLTVPASTLGGPISVRTPGGSAESAAGFTVTTAPLTPTVTLKLSGLTAGAVTPLSVAGSRVTLTVQLKIGATWVQPKNAFASISPKGEHSWKYAPDVKGTYRMRTRVAKTATNAATEKLAGGRGEVARARGAKCAVGMPAGCSPLGVIALRSPAERTPRCPILGGACAGAWEDGAHRPVDCI